MLTDDEKEKAVFCVDTPCKIWAFELPDGFTTEDKRIFTYSSSGHTTRPEQIFFLNGYLYIKFEHEYAGQAIVMSTKFIDILVLEESIKEIEKEGTRI